MEQKIYSTRPAILSPHVFERLMSIIQEVFDRDWIEEFGNEISPPRHDSRKERRDFFGTKMEHKQSDTGSLYFFMSRNTAVKACLQMFNMDDFNSKYLYNKYIKFVKGDNEYVELHKFYNYAFFCYIGFSSLEDFLQSTHFSKDEREEHHELVRVYQERGKEENKKHLELENTLAGMSCLFQRSEEWETNNYILDSFPGRWKIVAREDKLSVDNKDYLDKKSPYAQLHAESVQYDECYFYSGIVEIKKTHTPAFFTCKGLLEIDSPLEEIKKWHFKAICSMRSSALDTYMIFDYELIPVNGKRLAKNFGHGLLRRRNRRNTQRFDGYFLSNRMRLPLDFNYVDELFDSGLRISLGHCSIIRVISDE